MSLISVSVSRKVGFLSLLHEHSAAHKSLKTLFEGGTASVTVLVKENLPTFPQDVKLLPISFIVDAFSCLSFLEICQRQVISDLVFILDSHAIKSDPPLLDPLRTLKSRLTRLMSHLTRIRSGLNRLFFLHSTRAVFIFALKRL